MIQTYFTQIKTVVERYTFTPFVLESSMNFELRPGDQGYLTGTLTFVDKSRLHFSEYLDQIGQAIDRLMYTYHYQDEGHHLIFRYDNARHKPTLPYTEHKHLPDKVIAASAPMLDDVLAEIVISNGWM